MNPSLEHDLALKKAATSAPFGTAGPAFAWRDCVPGDLAALPEILVRLDTDVSGVAAVIGLYTIVLAAAVLGGIGSLTGAVVGGLLIGVIESINHLKPAALGSNWNQTVIFSVMILMLVYKPEGLLGVRSAERI